MNELVKLISLERTKIYDGQEEGFYTSTFEVRSEHMPLERFNLSQFTDNSLHELAVSFGQDVLDKVVSEGKFKVVTYSTPVYKGTDDLDVNFLVRDNHIIVLSNGETQPMRFKIYVEGVWQIL